MGAPAKRDMLIRYLDELMRSQKPEDVAVINKVVSRIFGNTATREAYEKLANTFDPLEGIEKYTYMPMKKRAGETSQELLQRYNTYINLENVLGDVLSGVGTAANIKNQALAQGYKNMANTRSQRERELYGANSLDKAAALSAPAASGLGNIEQALTSIIANRLYGNAALKRQAEMQAVMDAYNRNVGGTGLFFDARRKAGEGQLMPSQVD